MHRPLQPPFPAQPAITKRGKFLAFAFVGTAAIALVLITASHTQLPAEKERPMVRPAATALAVPPPTGRPNIDARLTLTGVVTGKPALAVIRVGEQPQQAFAAGQEILPGIRISTIYTDRIVLADNNSFRTLYLASARPNQASIQTSARRQNPLMDLDATGDDAASPDDYWREVRVLPHPGGGYTVQDVDAGSLYEKLGLQRGDIVYTLDMLRLVKLTELSRQNALADIDEIKLEVQRNGHTTLLQYRFDGESSSTEIR